MRVEERLRDWHSRWEDPPEDDPRQAWQEHLASLADDELQALGELSDGLGLARVSEDPDWQDEWESRQAAE